MTKQNVDYCFRNPDDPFVELIPETPEIASNSLVDGDLFKDSSLNSQESRKEISFSPSPPATTTNASALNFPTNNASSVKPMQSMGKTSKFGAVKVVKSVNFDEIEAKARIEREEADKRGLSNQFSSIAKSPLISPNSSSQSSSATITSPKVITPSTSISAIKSTSVPQKASKPEEPVIISKEQQDAMDRLGMGMRKMNINQSISSGASSSAAASAKCKQQQAISSEHFSHQNGKAEDSFVNDRLREIDTSKGISSDAFFGRSSCSPDPYQESDAYYNNNEDSSTYGRQHQKCTSPTNSNYSNLSNSAKDLASKLAEKAATIDIKGMKQSISAAGSRLSAYLQDFQNKS